MEMDPALIKGFQEARRESTLCDLLSTLTFLASPAAGLKTQATANALLVRDLNRLTEAPHRGVND